MKSVDISRVVIDIGGKEIELSLDEAKELKDILNETFGNKQEPIYIPSPYPVYEPWRYRHWEPYRITCGNTITFSTTTQS